MTAHAHFNQAGMRNWHSELCGLTFAPSPLFSYPSLWKLDCFQTERDTMKFRGLWSRLLRLCLTWITMNLPFGCAGQDQELQRIRSSLIKIPRSTFRAFFSSSSVSQLVWERDLFLGQVSMRSKLCLPISMRMRNMGAWQTCPWETLGERESCYWPGS